MDMHQEYLLHLADNALILGQRNAQWCGHAPVLEEDLALANNSLDLIGQARLLYQHLCAVRGDPACDEDRLAYFRDAPDYRNYTLLELPHSTALVPTAAAGRDFAVTIARNFLYATLMELLWEALCFSSDSQLAAIAGRAHKEAQYHVQHAGDWVLRLGDGTAESHRKLVAALACLMPYTQEFWTPSAMESAVQRSGVGVDMALLEPRWDAQVDAVLRRAGVARPPAGGRVSTGKLGQHSEHLDFVLTEMQCVARAHPDAVW